MSELFDLPEDFKFSVRSQGRTITESDFVQMTNLTWTTGAIHTDKELMADSEFGDRLLAGGCVLAFALGLSTPAIKPILESRGIRLIAMLGYDDVRFEAPLRPNETVHVESNLVSIATTRRADRGVVTVADTLFDGAGRTICRYLRIQICDISSGAFDTKLRESSDAPR